MLCPHRPYKAYPEVSKALIESCQVPGATPQQSTSLLRISTTSQVFLLRSQVQSAWLQPHAISMSTFKLKISQASRGRAKPYHRPSPKLLAEIILMGGTGPRTNQLLLISLSVAKQALQSLGMPACMITSLESFKFPAQLVLNTPAAALRQQNAPPSLQPEALHMDAELPSSLDPSPPVLEERERYSLTQHPTLARSTLLQLQLREFKAWCTRDFQAGRAYASVQSITWESTEKECMLLLGFAHFKKQWAQPGLAAGVNASVINAYISAKKARGDAWSTALKTFAVLLKLISWWLSKPSLAADSVHKLVALQAWLVDMRMQLTKVWHNAIRDPVTMQEEGKWMHAREVVCLFDKHRAEVMHAFADATSVLSPAQARRVHDVTLCCCLFGYMPPLRLYCIRTMVAPHVSRVCPEEGCSTPARPCAGNRVMINPAGSLCFHLPHHKNAMRWGKLAIQFDVPLGLLELMQLYIDKARPVLLAECEVSLPEFFLTSTGLRFTSARFCQYFQEIMVRMGAPAIAPKDLRHIFVVDRCDDTNAPGPVNAGAAMVMGHSERAWAEVYDLRFARRMANDAVSAMADWRAHHLRDQGAVGTSGGVEVDIERSFVTHADGMMQAAAVEDGEGVDGDESDEELLAFARSQPVHNPRRISSSPESENDLQIELP